MNGRPLVLLLSSLIGLSVSQAPSCASVGFSATVRIAIGTNTYPSELSGQIGNPLILRCEVTFGGSNPPTIGSYTWEFNGQIINTDTRNSLTINMLRSSDGGVYRCRATTSTTNNRCQTQYSNPVTVNTPPTLVSISPSIINILDGESFQISCQAEGFPTPAYEWYKAPDTSIILSNQSTYSVQAATVAASGTYVCTASNGQTPRQQGIAMVTVSPPPPTTAVARPTTEPVTTTLAATEEVTTAAGNFTEEASPTGSTALYIGIGIISAVSVICFLLTFFCFITWLCYSYKKEKQATNYEGEEMQMEYQEEAFYQDSEEAALETSVPIEAVDTNEAVIPQPNKKKTRGKHRKF